MDLDECGKPAGPVYGSPAETRAIGLTLFRLPVARDCDRCCSWLSAGFPAFEVEQASVTPWAAHTVLCPACASRMVEKYGQRSRC